LVAPKRGDTVGLFRWGTPSRYTVGAYGTKVERIDSMSLRKKRGAGGTLSIRGTP